MNGPLHVRNQPTRLLLFLHILDKSNIKKVRNAEEIKSELVRIWKEIPVYVLRAEYKVFIPRMKQVVYIGEGETNIIIF